MGYVPTPCAEVDLLVKFIYNWGGFRSSPNSEPAGGSEDHASSVSAAAVLTACSRGLFMSGEARFYKGVWVVRLTHVSSIATLVFPRS